MRLFFYGTLLDADVRALVLGRADRPGEPATGRLDGWRRVRALGRAYPIILRAPEASVEGVVTGELSGGEVARLQRYEGPDYMLVACRPVLASGEPVSAQVFRPVGRLTADPAPWEFGQWLSAEKTRFLAGLRRGGGHG